MPVPVSDTPGLDLREQVGRVVLRIRTTLGLTQDELAARVNATRGAIRAIEHGSHDLTLEMVAVLAAACRMTPHDLICGFSDREPVEMPPGHPLTMAGLARITRAVDAQAQHLHAHHGDVAVSAETIGVLLDTFRKRLAWEHRKSLRGQRQ